MGVTLRRSSGRAAAAAAARGRASRAMIVDKVRTIRFERAQFWPLRRRFFYCGMVPGARARGAREMVSLFEQMYTTPHQPDESPRSNIQKRIQLDMPSCVESVPLNRTSKRKTRIESARSLLADRREADGVGKARRRRRLRPEGRGDHPEREEVVRREERGLEGHRRGKTVE